MPKDAQSIPDDVKAELKQVRDQVWDAFGQWHLLVGLFGDQSTVRALTWAFRHGAGGLIQQAIRSELAVALGRLLDPAMETHKKKAIHNLSLERMICHAEVHAKGMAVGMRNDLEEARRRFEPLKRWRDKYHAHRDQAVAMGFDPESLPTVDRQVMEHLLASLRQLMGRICLALDESVTPYELAYAGAADQVLAFILPKYQASRERLRWAEEAL